MSGYSFAIVLEYGYYHLICCYLCGYSITFRDWGKRHVRGWNKGT